jgi:heat shock protein HslJ
MNRQLTILLSIIVAGYACSPKTKPVMNIKPDASFGVTRWKMIKLAGIEVFPALRKDVFIQFDDQIMQFQGHAGCNHMRGSYTYKDGKLKIGPAAMTRMFCEGPGMQVEDIFSKKLDEIDNYQIRGDRLVFRNGSEFVAEFEALYL